MDRRELEERYPEVGRPIPTDLGRMVRNVALVRLALLVGCGVTLAIGLCVFGGLAWFAIVGTRPIVASPTPTPVPTATPASSMLPAVAEPRNSASGWSMCILVDAVPDPWGPGAPPNDRGCAAARVKAG